jgi:PAS domain S-box-containing protein
MEALLRRRVIIGFILAVLLTGLMGFLSWRSTRLAAQEADLVAHTHAVMRTLDVAVEHAIELETSARGFALTGQDLLLTHYEAARGTIDQDFGTLRHLTTDNPNQQRRLEVLEPQMADAIGFADHLVSARQNARAIPGASEIKQSERVVDAVRDTIHQMQAEEMQLLNERSQKTGAARRLTTFVTVAGTLVGAVFLLLAGFAVNREIGVSARARTQVSALNAELEQRTAAVQSEIAARSATEQKLRASEELSRLFLDSIKDYAVYMLDPEGRVASWNAGAAKIKGYRAEEIIGKHFSCFYTAEDQQDGKPELELQKATASGRFEEEGHRVRKDGSVLWANVVITPVYDSGGTLRGYSKVVRDITERKAAEEALRQSEDRQAGIISSAMDAIITVDSEQRIVLFNAAAERMFRCPAAEALRQPIERFVPQRFHAAHAGHIRKFAKTGVTNRAMGPVSALWAKRADGEEFQIEASISQIVTGGKKLFTVILRDVTERKQAEEALRESQDQLTGIIQSAMDTIITVDDQQHIVLFNAAAEKMFRCPAAEAVGQPIERFIPQRFRSQHAGHIRRFGETGGTSRGMGTLGALWALRADGEEFQIEASISQMEARGKKLFTVILRDISERKQADEALRESQAQMIGIIQSAMDTIITVDDEQRIVLFNTAAEKMFGCVAADVVGQSIERFIPQRFRSQHAGHIRRFGETGVTSRGMGTLGALWAVRMDGREFQIEASISQIETRGKKLFTVILRDVTERKQAEQDLAGQSQELVKQASEIRKLNDELEQRVLQRTAQLEAANKELEAFTYSVSHDLRAPLRHIGGFSKILAEEFGPKLDPTAQHYLQRIEEGTRRMGLLVDELLNLARVGRHSLSLQVTGLNSIVAEIVSMLKPESEGRQVEWIIADLPFVECDPILIKQVLQNLMANALKFTRPRPRAVIEIGQVEENGSPAIFVRDNGVGFSMKYADKLFGVFQRLHRPEDFEGTGIGLATVQRIIQKHGGRVWVEAELDRGATFYFSLGAHEQLEVRKHSQQKNHAATIGA